MPQRGACPRSRGTSCSRHALLWVHLKRSVFAAVGFGCTLAFGARTWRDFLTRLIAWVPFNKSLASRLEAKEE